MSQSSIDVLKALIEITKVEINNGGKRYYKLISPMLFDWVRNMASKLKLEERDFLIFSDLVLNPKLNFLFFLQH